MIFFNLDKITHKDVTLINEVLITEYLKTVDS